MKHGHFRRAREGAVGLTAARVVFGLSAVAFGVVSLVWHDSDLWQHVHAIGPQAATIVVWCCTFAQVLGGIALLLPRAARPASVVLGIVYGLLTLGCVEDIAQAPASYGSYIDFFELGSLVCGALAACAATEASATRSLMLGRIARIGLGICTVSFTIAQIYYFGLTTKLVPTWIPFGQTFWAIVTTVAFALAAIAILVNVRARLAVRLMALMIGLFGVLVWVPLVVAKPGTLFDWSELSLNFLIAGATWLVAEPTRYAQ
ncbi:MAG TPA: DoxX family protein [Candidatus Sulfotelmatobacter sp.]|nr:DoxX family protein [Candidatus Sulfotelmatobacter sp.]